VALFKFLKKEENPKKEFEEKTVVCENVNNELLKVSKEYNIPLSKLDFDILKVKTYIKLEEDYVEADEETLALLNSEKFLLNENMEIKQVYEIKIKKYKPKNGFEILGKVELNKYLTHAKFHLSHKSDLKNYNEVEFYKEMNKKKLKNSLIINIMDEQLKKDIKNLTKKLITGELKEDYEIELCKGIDPVLSVEGKIIYHYKRKKKSVKKELIYPVKYNDVLIEIIKPKEGRIGRNCKGKVILVSQPKEFKIPEIIYDEQTIDKKEDENKILYIAKKDGFITIEDKKYIIKDRLEIKQINIKTGNVQDGDEAKVKLDVKESDALKEAIGDDMIVETKELIVRGNVGNKAKIKSVTLKIEGQTHKNSLIESVSAKINKHKGKLKAKNILINSLEGGEVTGKKIKIKNAIGGVVIGHDIEIENLLSHTKIYALNKIVIKNLKGEENLLAISPKKVLGGEDIDGLLQRVKEIEQNINILKREIKKKKEIIEKNRFAYEELKNIYIANRQQNKKTNPAVLMKLKEHKLLHENYQKLKEKLKNNQKDKEELLEIIDNIQNAIYNAKIISLSPWKAYNRIEFDIIEPPISLKYDTKGDEGICGFKIKFIGETPKIIKIKVNNDSGSERKDI